MHRIVCFEEQALDVFPDGPDHIVVFSQLRFPWWFGVDARPCVFIDKRELVRTDTNDRTWVIRYIRALVVGGIK